MKGAIPNPAARRLSVYLRRLEELTDGGVAKVSSDDLAASLGLTAAQVRKDLACCGQFGRPGVGYSVPALMEHLRHALGTDKTWNVIVVGAGDLGRALARYRGFVGRGFRIVAAFDVAMGRVGRSIGDIPVHHVDHMGEIVRKYGVKLGIIAAPAEAAQEIANTLCAAGVAGILNFAPRAVKPAGGVAVLPVDLAASLEHLSFLVGGAAAGK
jgi:redox-sensing transcriptional repressor